MGSGAGDGSGPATGAPPGALTALLQEVAAADPRDAELLSLPPGTVIGRFEIIWELGRGGFGVVYEALDRDLGRQVALKVVRPGRIREEEGKVVREAEAIARLQHPNLITLFDVGQSEGGPYLVFELLRGKTLQERMDDGPLPVQEAVHIATEVARGLAHAHAEGVVHRDLKPSNVFVTTRGQVKILDFGMAHAFGWRRLHGGTPAYMAPEQWEDAPEDERTDVFALGVLLYRMLTGEYPFPEGEGRWAAEPAVPRKLDVPGAPDLAERIGKMLDRTPTARPRDGAAVLAALTPIEDALRSRPADGAPPAHATRKRATFGDLLAELKRRHVFRVMLGYGIFAFAVLQVTEPILHGAHLPDWVLSLVLAVLALGFPVAVILAWVYDLTAQGVKRTPSATGPASRLPGRTRYLLPLAVSVAVLAIAAAGAGVWYGWKRITEHRVAVAGAVASPSIAVLPFTDMSPQKDQEYLSDGIAEEILNVLTRLQGLKVIGRTSSFYFKGKTVEPSEIGRRLAVTSLLEGSVRKEGNRIRVSARLVNASDGAPIWAESYDREAGAAFAIQEDIARDVARALRVKLLDPGAGRVRGRSTNVEAYEQYLLGQQHLRAMSNESIPAARAAFERAVALDPGFAAAYAGLAEARRMMAGYLTETAEETTTSLRQSLVAAEKAIQLDPDLPDGYVARALYRHHFQWAWKEGLDDFERAMALSVGSAYVTEQYGRALAKLGRSEEALVQARRATELDPLSSTAWSTLASILDLRGDAAAAESAARRCAQVAPDSMDCYAHLGHFLLRQGRTAEAIDAFRRSPYEPFRLQGLAMAHFRAGDESASRAALDTLVQKYANQAAYQVARAHAWRGEADAAFQWLERAYVDHDPGLAWVGAGGFRELHSDPRWKPFLRRMNLPVDESSTMASGRPVEAAAPPSIAVLPFVDMSPKHDQEYFADGVAEEIRNALTHVRRLKVIGRTSSFSFKGAHEDLRVIGQKLGAGHLLEGSVRKAGNQVRITAQLVEARGGSQVWSQTFDRKVTDVFVVQQEIAQAVASALKASLVPAGANRTTTPEAYEQYLRGRRLLATAGPESVPKAVAAFQRAVGLDPEYAPAHVGLAEAYGDMAGFVAETSDDLIRYARLDVAAAERAIALDPESPDGYAARAYSRLSYLWDWKGGLEDIERVAALGSGDKGTNPEYALTLALMGQLPEGVAAARRATGYDPLSAGPWLSLGFLLGASGELTAGLEATRRCLQFSPDNPVCGYVLALTLLDLGRTDEALAQARQQKHGWVRLALLGIVQHRIGNARESQAALDELRSANAMSSAYQIAQVHAARGETDAAFEWLERARLQRDGGLKFVRYDWVFRGLRGDPRWKPFLREMNLPVE